MMILVSRCSTVNRGGSGDYGEGSSLLAQYSVRRKRSRSLHSRPEESGCFYCMRFMEEVKTGSEDCTGHRSGAPTPSVSLHDALVALLRRRRLDKWADGLNCAGWRADFQIFAKIVCMHRELHAESLT